jgi:L-histidine N-alpha-methyltransferase
MSDDDHILLGFDRVKDIHVLEAAYNDAEGITAAFNLNLLRVLNKELQADFKLEGFQHKAIYNEDHKQIEMYLISESEHVVNIEALEASLEIQPDERIRTEISRKFSMESITQLLQESGLAIVNHQQADQAYYSLVLAKRFV